MDISCFREFLVLAETCSYWAAAERLFISQSALSKRIRAMEKELGGPLFLRTTRRVELSELGRFMLPYARSIVQLQREYEAALCDRGGYGMETLELASIPSMAQYDITGLLMEFHRDDPGVRIHTQEGDTVQVREWLLEKRCELGFIRDSEQYFRYDPARDGLLEKVVFDSDEIVAVLPQGHPLAGGPCVELAQLEGERMALLKEGTMPYDLCLRACREAGFNPQVAFTSHSMEALLDVVSRAGCVSLMFSRPLEFIRREAPGRAAAVAAVPIAPSIRTEICICWRRDRPLSDAAARFVGLCTAGRQAAAAN